MSYRKSLELESTLQIRLYKSEKAREVDWNDVRSRERERESGNSEGRGKGGGKLTY